MHKHFQWSGAVAAYRGEGNVVPTRPLVPVTGDLHECPVCGYGAAVTTKGKIRGHRAGGGARKAGDALCLGSGKEVETGEVFPEVQK